MPLPDDPILIEWRDTIVEIVETLTVANNKIILSEIPHRYRKVKITGYTEVDETETPTTGQFQVNYNNAIIQFGGSVADGTNVDCRYFGRGIVKIGGSRIFLNQENNDIQQNNVQDFASDIATRINNIVSQAGSDNTEIVDARLDDEGVTHVTLKARLDTQHTNLKQDTIDLPRMSMLPNLHPIYIDGLTVGNIILSWNPIHLESGTITLA
jgi:hypothetical protein